MKYVLFALFTLTSFISTAGNHEMASLYAAPAKKKKKTTGVDLTRLLIGPGFGFGAGTRAFSFNLSPSVAYCLTEDFHVGITLGFNYYQEAYDYNNFLNGQRETYKYKIPAYSASVFARYIFFDRMIVGIEPEINNTKLISSNYTYSLTTGKIIENSKRLTVPSVLIGGGYSQRISNFGYTYLMAMYDVVQNPNARYYQTLDFRFGIMIPIQNK